MLEELENKIYEIAPILYKQKDLDETVTCMCWGFECPDAWFDIIFELSKKLENINCKLAKFNVEINASQVKEKYGTLHFYYDVVYKTKLTNNDDRLVKQYIHRINDEIMIAEQKTEKICAICGNPATTCTTGYILYLCEKCKNKEEK